MIRTVPVAFHLLIQAGVLLMAVMSGLWWAIDDFSQSEGLIYLVGTWALAFNYLPTKGWHCIREPIVKFYYLPMALLGLVGFLYGAFVHET
jgi:hypothetical protein